MKPPKTTRQVMDEQLRLHPYLKPQAPEAVMTLVVPGARALGEQWQKVTIGHDGNDIVVDREETTAPVGNRPVMVMSGPDAEYTSYIFAAAAEKAQGRLVYELSPQEKWEAVNRAWHEFVEQKLRQLKGQSTFGPGGSVQRQRVAQNPATRPAHHKE